MRVSLYLNHACNLRCVYCYAGAKFHRPMPWEIARRGVELALPEGGQGTGELSFYGGEPLMEWDLLRRSVDHATERSIAQGRRVQFTITTNGTLLDGRKLDYLDAHGFFVGLSLDGCRAAHEATRPRADGGSSYDAVVRALKGLQRRRMGRQIIAVIDPANVDWLPDSFDALLDLGVRTMSFNLNYEGDWDEAARDRFLVALRALGERYIAAHRRGAPFSCNLLDSKIVTHLKGGFSEADRCDFGAHEVAVSPSGRLYPCDRLVGEDTSEDVVIGDVWAGIDPVRRDALIADKNALDPDCATCALQPRCMRWCGCVNHAMTGRVGEVAGLLCWFEQRIIEEADRCAEVLFSEQAPGFLRRFYAPRVRAPVEG